MSAHNIWGEQQCRVWHEAFDSYPQAIAAQGSERLSRLDPWYRDKLPALIASRAEPHITLDELEGVAGWKMSRGEWRERNRQLIKGNAPELVIELSRQALSEVPGPSAAGSADALRKPVSTLSKLAGVGPATASAVLAAYAPHVYPFFDELVAAQIPGFGPVAFTAKEYLAYAGALAERAAGLNAACGHRTWTPQDVAQALWAASGGKAAQ